MKVKLGSRAEKLPSKLGKKSASKPFWKKHKRTKNRCPPEDTVGELVESESDLPAEIVDAGDLSELPAEPEASSESVEELVDEGQYYEAEVVDGVENAPSADVEEVTMHERPSVEGESVPDEELPGGPL